MLVIKAIAQKEIIFFVVIIFVRNEEVNISWSTFDILDCANSKILSINIENKSKDANFTYIDKRIFSK